MSTSDRLTVAFRALRRRGWWARKNWQCCQGCGWSSLPEDAGDRVVFYHAQDAECLAATGRVHLAWSGLADELLAELRAAGLAVEWSGAPDRRIEVWEPPSAAAAPPRAAPAEAPGYH